MHRNEKETLYSFISFLYSHCCLFSAIDNDYKRIHSTYVCVYKGDTIPSLRLPNVYVFKPLKFKNEKERREYYRLVRNVKKTLPLARAINRAIIETYEYLETLPDKKAREKHLKLVEKGLKEQYTPVMKKLTFAQGKLLIKLVNRETDSSSYELVKAFMGPLKQGFIRLLPHCSAQA